VIVVTSSNAEVDRQMTERLGVQAYFQKPSSLDQYMELAKVVKQVLGSGAGGSGSS
jgi:hypothetical protein